MWISPDPGRQFFGSYSYGTNPINTINKDGRKVVVWVSRTGEKGNVTQSSVYAESDKIATTFSGYGIEVTSLNQLDNKVAAGSYYGFIRNIPGNPGNHNGRPQLENAVSEEGANMTGVQIHRAANRNDVHGCLGIGTGQGTDNNGNGTLTGTASAYNSLTNLLESDPDAMGQGDHNIEIIYMDPPESPSSALPEGIEG